MRRPLTKLLITSLTALGLPLGLMTAGPDAAPAALAATASCYDAPGNATCNGVSPGQYSTWGFTCWMDAQEVPAAGPDVRYYNDPGTDVNYWVELWYSPHCRTNWAEVDAQANPVSGAWFSGKVRRYPGPDGGYLMYHAGKAWVPAGQYQSVYSPMVYAPADKAQACLSLPPFTGNNDQITCTTAW